MTLPPTGSTARERATCRACDEPLPAAVLDLGNQRLSEFRDDPSVSEALPLEVTVCPRCALVQLRHTAPPDDLYHDRYSFRSGVSEVVAADLVANVATGLRSLHREPRAWLDIGCNDGTLLGYVPSKIERVGVDPLRHLRDDALRHADRVVTGFFDPTDFEPRSFDVVTSISVFYDLDDPRRFAADVERVLAPGGVWVIQQNYLPLMIENASLDNVSHEHLTYHTLGTLEWVLKSAGLRVIDALQVPVNGGCLRTVVARADEHQPHPHVAVLGRTEIVDGYTDPVDVTAHLGDLSRRADRALRELRRLVTETVAYGGNAYVYGASTRGAVLWQAARLDSRVLTKVVDRNPEKVGRYMSAIGAPIISEDEFRRDPPDLAVVGPWWLRDAIVERERDYLAAGGRLVFPLPELEVVSA